MMFKKSYDVPANTTANNQNMQKLAICRGAITGWICWAPKKAVDLLQFRVEYHHLQIFPFSGSEWFYDVSRPFLIPDEIEIFDPPFELDIYAVNNDDTFSHRYHVNVVIIPIKEKTPVTTETTSWFQRLRELIGGS